MDVVTLLADRLRLHDAMRAPQHRSTDDEVDDRDSGTASDDESARAEGDIVDMLMLHSLTAAAAAAAAQRQQSSMTSLLQEVANCRRSSFSRQSRFPSSMSSAVSTTFRPVVAGATAAVRPGLERAMATSDDEWCVPATRKRRRDDDSSDDALTSSDDDEEVRTIFCDEPTMTSRAPVSGVEAPSEQRRWAVTSRRAVSDFGVVHRPSLNLYKMQRMRIGRRVSLMRRHSPLGRPRPLTVLQSSTNAIHRDSASSGKCEPGGGVPAYHFRSLTTATKRSCVDSRRRAATCVASDLSSS